jgi:hypothetical protein
MKSKSKFGTRKEFDALSLIVDLASCTIADATQDKLDYTKRTRRNGGYSGDLRIAEKYLIKWFKELEKELK